MPIYAGKAPVGALAASAYRRSVTMLLAATGAFRADVDLV
jgi:hypothetical protein